MLGISADPKAWRPWRHPDPIEFATLEYIDWFNNRRLHGEIGYVPPAEFEEVFNAPKVEEQIKGRKISTEPRRFRRMTWSGA